MTKGKYLVDIDERLKLCLLNIDAKLMKCWLVLIYCLFFDGVLFESGAPNGAVRKREIANDNDIQVYRDEL